MKLIAEKKIFFFLLFLLLLSYARSPDIFNQGRFWAEDGSLYFQNALKNSFLENFFKIYKPTVGYYNLFSRITALVSSKFTLEIAALVNVYLSYSVLIYIFFLILVNNSYLYNKNIEKFAYCLLVVVCPTFVPEIWVNSVNAQIYLSVAAIFILYSKNIQNLFFKYLNPIILFIGGFSSVYVFFLTPFFFIKYKFLKDKYNLINLIILFVSFIFQLIFYVYSKLTAQTIFRNTNIEIDFNYLITFFYNTIAKLFFPKEVLISLYSIFFTESKMLTLIIITITIIIMIYSFNEIRKILKNNNIQLFITFSLIIIFISLILIIILFSGEYFAGRYSSIPGFIICLIIFNLTFQKIKGKFFKKYLIFLTLLILISGFYQYRPHNNYRIQYLDCIKNCVEWKYQVKNFRNDNKKNKLIVWPYNKEDNLEKFEYQNILIVN